MRKMKKVVSVLFAGVLAGSCLTGCSGQSEEKAVKENTVSETKKEKETPKVALITGPLGVEEFLMQAYNEMKVLSDEYGLEWASMECSDNTMWKENIEAASAEGYDLIIGIGWQAAEPFSEIAESYPDTDYVVIDTTCDNENVTSIGFKEQEGAYIQGVMMATAFPDETNFGYVCSYQNQATYKYRYGYSQGVLSVNPDAQFVYNYTNSYSDTSMAYEYAVQQQAAGCKVIMGGCSASSNTGIYQAALEFAEKGTPIYTTGLSVDQTTEENPYILGGLLKNTGACTRVVVEDYMNGNLKKGPQLLGVAENAFGVVYVTTEKANYRNTDVMTDEVIEAGKKAAEAIIKGDLVIEVPEEKVE